MPDDFSAKGEEAVFEVGANTHVYRWGLGRQMRWEQYKMWYHLPGHRVCIDRKHYRVTNRWTVSPQ